MTHQREMDVLWLIVSALLVFMMQLGFAMVETGCVRSKNTINVAMKNLADATFGFAAFWLFGFGLMFGEDVAGMLGTSKFAVDGDSLWDGSFFFFQAMFATTSATIVSGAVAERMKFSGYVLTAILVTTLLYPIFGHWAWGPGGWLKTLGFVDFAGSTVVHSVGAWVGLAGAVVLGPRIGRFHKEQVRRFSPSNHNFIVFGAFILWFAWFGFNGGSTLAFTPTVAKVLINTLLSGAAGAISAYFICIVFFGKVAVEIFSFGIIAGLVGITAGCFDLSASQSLFVGAVSSVIMFTADRLLIRLRIDDPLSAVAVHGFGGIWGTLAVGIFGTVPSDLTRLGFVGVQLLGILSAFALTFPVSLAFFSVLKSVNVFRVTKRSEVVGLNVTEHQARLPWVDTIESIIRVMRSGNMHRKIHEERGTELGVVARFFNCLLEKLRHKQVELTASNQALRSEVNIDALTKVFNRRGLFEKIKEREGCGRDFSIIIFDIDHFKKVNDTYGHKVGDDVLKEMAKLIKGMVRGTDVFARWGGEEFVLLTDTSDSNAARSAAEKVRRQIEKHDFTTVHNVTCSFGVYSPSEHLTPFDILLEEADKALYQAKQLGRNRVCCGG